MKQTDEEWLKGAKASFDESVDNLDAETLSKLNRGRQRALQAARPSARPWVGWMPATGVAAAILVAFIVLRVPAVDEPLMLETASSDFEILLGEEDLAIFEDLEFYSWLASIDFDEDADVG